VLRDALTDTTVHTELGRLDAALLGGLWTDRERVAEQIFAADVNRFAAVRADFDAGGAPPRPSWPSGRRPRTPGAPC